MEVLVTLGMAVWSPRRQDWLLTAVDSALAQRGCRFELLIVDDGSPEPVAPLLGSRLEDPRVRLLRVPHGGLAAARNVMIEHASGDYIRFVDDDDFYPPDGTAQMLARTAGRQDRVGYGTTLVCDADLRPRWRMAARQEGDAVTDALLARWNVRLGGGVLLPRRVVELVGRFYESMTILEDWDFAVRALEHAHVSGTRAVVHSYRRHPSAMTANISGRDAARLIVDRYFARHPEQRGTRLETRAYAMLDAQQARVLATRRQWRPAARHAVAALRRDPLAFGNEFPQVRAALRGRAATALGRNP